MRSFINAISNDVFVIDRQDRMNVAGRVPLRADILGRLRIYGRRALAGSAHLPGEERSGKPKHRSAVPAVASRATTALGSSTGWRLEQPTWLPVFACCC